MGLLLYSLCLQGTGETIWYASFFIFQVSTKEPVHILRFIALFLFGTGRLYHNTVIKLLAHRCDTKPGNVVIDE